MSRPSQTESVYVQTLPDGKCLCPDFCAFKNVYVQTFVRSKQKIVCSKIDNFAFKSRQSCVPKILSRDFHASKTAYVQTFVRSKLPMSKLLCVPNQQSCAPNLIICAFKSRLSCVQKILFPDFRAFKTAYVQIYVRSKLPMSRLLCVPNQQSSAPNLIICAFKSRLSCVQKILSPDFRALKTAYVHTFVRSKQKFVRSKFYNCHKNLLIFISSSFFESFRCLNNKLFD